MLKFLKNWWCVLACCSLALVVNPAIALGQDAVGVAVLNIEGSGIDGQLLTTLTSVLRNEAQQHESYDVVNPAPINLSEIVVVLGCNPQAVTCLKQAAEQLNARVLIYGTVTRSESGYPVTVDIFDSSTGRVIHNLTRTLPDTDDPVITFRREVETFFSNQRVVLASRLQIGSNVEGAQIRIEDTTVGTTPYERTGLPAGRYRVEVSALGHDTWRTVVELVDGADVRLWATLNPAEAVKPVVPAEPVVAPKPKPRPRTPDPVLQETVATSNNWGAWGAIGVGGAALLGSGVMALMMNGVESDIEAERQDNTLTERRYTELVDQGRSYELSHRILLGIGGVATTAGVLWLILAPDGSSSGTATIEQPGFGVSFQGTGVSADFRW